MSSSTSTKSDYGLVSVCCEVWEGFIFINFDGDAAALSEYLGDFATGLEGYPFHEMTEHYSYRSEINANWKLFIDAFTEFYHAPILHMKQAEKEEAEKLAEFGFEALAYDIKGDHSMVSSWGGMRPPKDLSMVKPIEQILHSGLFGPWDRPDIKGIQPDELPPAINPGRHKTWGTDSFEQFPNFTLLFWAPGWYLTYNYWPTAVDKHIFEADLYFVPPKILRQRLSQELAAVTFKEYAFQDANTLEATQTQIGTRVVTDFPLCDQEILLRHLHMTAHRYVDRYQEPKANGSASGSGVSANGKLAEEKDAAHVEVARGVRRPGTVRRLVPTDRGGALRQAPGLDDGRHAGVLRRRHRAPRGDHGPRRRTLPARGDAGGRQGDGASGTVDRHGELPHRGLEATARAL